MWVFIKLTLSHICTQLQVYNAKAHWLCWEGWVKPHLAGQYSETKKSTIVLKPSISLKTENNIGTNWFLTDDGL